MTLEIIKNSIKLVYLVTNARNVDQITAHTLTNKTLRRQKKYFYFYLLVYLPMLNGNEIKIRQLNERPY